MNLSTIILNAMNQGLHQGSFEQFKSYFDSNQKNDRDENIAQMMDNACRKADPGYKSLTAEEKEIRRQQHERARELVPRVTYDMHSGAKDIPNNSSRAANALFYGLKDTPQDKARKQQILHTIGEGTAKERHDLFVSVINEFADFNLDEYREMSLDQKLDRLPELMPKLYKAMECKGLINEFKKFDCGITPQEEARFNTLSETLHAYAGELYAELDTVLSPYYQDLDLTRLNLDNATEQAIDDEMENQGYAYGSNSIDDYRSYSTAKVFGSNILKVTGEVFNEFKKNGVDLTVMNIERCTQDGTPMPLEDNRQYERALRNGETLYFVNNQTGSAREMLAVHDIYRNGYPTVISMERARELEEINSQKPVKMEPVEKPNGLVRFFDSINRFFGGKGLDSVNKYNEYVQNNETYDSRLKQYQYAYNDKLKEIRSESVKKGYTDDFNKAAKEAKGAVIAKKMSVGIASAYLLRGKLKPDEVKWAKENPEAFREGFSKLKEDYIEASNGKLSQDDKDYLAEIDQKAEAAVKSLDAKEEPVQKDSSVKINANEKQQQASAVEKANSEPASISLP